MKSLKISIFFIFFFSFFVKTLAQQTELAPRCVHSMIFKKRALSEPDFLKNRLAFEQKIKAITKQKNSRVSGIQELIKIPVVVHVIHNNTSGTIGGKGNANISDEQIKSQIEVLNEDYRRKTGTLGFNSNPAGADMNIEFFLADTDPDGNPSTGIIRKQVSVSSYDPTDGAIQKEISNQSYWPSTCYLNIWVTTLSNNYLGYSQFPAAPNFDGLDPTGDETVDGLFIDYKFFGRNSTAITSKYYKYGRTTTHEVGHWFGLIHTWGDEDCGDDYCDDIPTTQGPNLTTFCVDKFSNCNGVRTRNMIENYMDYTIDSCMNVFTTDQAKRVQAVLVASPSRAKLIECISKLPESEQLQVTIVPNPIENNLIKGTILFKGRQTVYIYLVSTSGQSIDYQEFTNKQSFQFALPEAGYPPGIYLLKVVAGAQSYSTRILIK